MSTGIWIVNLDEWSDNDEEFTALLELVDDDSKAKIKRYHHRVDSRRCLVGRLLPRAVLSSEAILTWNEATFQKAHSGRPHLTTKLPNGEVFDYNITHDSSYVACAFVHNKCGTAKNPFVRVGIDVMLLALPRWASTNADFLNALKDQLTVSEMTYLHDPALSPEAQLKRIYRVWTLKEALTKALGMGLGMDFARVELTFPTDEKEMVQISVDRRPEPGWKLYEWILEDGDTKHMLAVAASPEAAGQGGQAPFPISRKTVQELVSYHNLHRS